MVTGCINKTAITGDKFKTTLEAKDNTEVLVLESEEETQYSANIRNENSQLKYTIEFTEFKLESRAEEFYDSNQELIEKEAEEAGQKATTEVNIGNHSKYTVSADGKYTVISRIGNTVLRVDTVKEYKDEVNEILKELDY